MKNVMTNDERYDWKRTGNLTVGTTEASDLGLPPGLWPETIFVKFHTVIKSFHLLRSDPGAAMPGADGKTYYNAAREGLYLFIFND